MADILSADPTKVSRASVFQLLDGLALSGRLVAEAGGNELGWADFVDGKPVEAAVGATRGVDALYDLLVIDVAQVRFVSFPDGRQPRGLSPLADVLGLVMNGCRLRDEYVRMKPLVAAVSGPLPPDLPSPVRAVVDRLDGVSPLGDAIFASGVSPAVVIDELRDLFESQVLTHIATVAPPAPPVDFEEAVASGRRHFREGDLERAEADLLWAVAQRPEDRVVRQNLARVREARARHWVGAIPRPRGR